MTTANPIAKPKFAWPPPCPIYYGTMKLYREHEEVTYLLGGWRDVQCCVAFFFGTRARRP
jgi:hypothetical protein